MLPYEVVVRREAHGSYLKRNPHFAKGQLFPQLELEFFLKTKDGNWNDKRVYRDGGALDDVVAKYRRVAEITGRFTLPRQRIIMWRGSASDKTESFSEALGDLSDLMTVVTCSVHKQPVAAAGILYRMAHEIPDSEVIAYIGRSNGAGPTLSAISTVPVIPVPP